MWKNELEKFEFDMEELKVFDVFAGVGALHDSLKRLGVPLKITNISEIDIDATITYAAYHIEGFKDLEFEYPSDDEMKQWLMDRNIGYSYEKGKSSVPRMKKDKLKLAYKASYLLNNLGDISKIDYNDIEDFDMFNMSFPCTDLSIAGDQKGMTNEDGTPTRSGLVTYSIKAIKSKKPKYIMIENVKALIQKKFIGDFYSIINEIESYGYKCYYPTKEDKKGNILPTCLNAKDYGIPQNRERIFAIGVRNDVDDAIDRFPEGFDSGVRLKDILEDMVDEKYYLSDEIQKRFSPINNEKIDRGGKTVCEQRVDEGLRFFKNNVCGSLRTIDSGGDKRIIETENKLEKVGLIGKDSQANRVYSKDNLACTQVGEAGGLGAKTGLYAMEDYKIRKLTPLECMRLMGFKDFIYYNSKELGMGDSQLYKQAGNSIVVNCLYYIFKELFKNYIK